MKVTRKIGMILEDLDDQVFEKISSIIRDLDSLGKIAKRLNNRKVLDGIGKAHKILEDTLMSLD